MIASFTELRSKAVGWVRERLEQARRLRSRKKTIDCICCEWDCSRDARSHRSSDHPHPTSSLKGGPQSDRRLHHLRKLIGASAFLFVELPAQEIERGRCAAFAPHERCFDVVADAQQQFDDPSGAFSANSTSAHSCALCCAVSASGMAAAFAAFARQQCLYFLPLPQGMVR